GPDATAAEVRSALVRSLLARPEGIASWASATARAGALAPLLERLSDRAVIDLTHRATEALAGAALDLEREEDVLATPEAFVRARALLSASPVAAALAGRLRRDPLVRRAAA